MTTIVGLDQVADTREELGAPGNATWRTFFLRPDAGTRLPQAFLIDYAAASELVTHFHDVDEFQIVVAGDGLFGRHAVQPFMVHFARAFTPYGPIVAGAQGLSFMTLRARRDSAGPQKLPEKRKLLDSIRGRKPWQASATAAFPADAGVGMKPLDGMTDDVGLAAWTVNLPARAGLRLPDVRGSDGEYAVLLKGAVHFDSGLHHAPAVAFVAAEEEPLDIVAGADGAQLMVLRFPVATTSGSEARFAR